MGQVAQVGPDAYNARRCALGAGLPPSSTAMNVNRLCSSGLQAIVSGAQSILAGQSRVVVAGGDESMSRQPFLTYGERAGWRLGSREAIDGTLSLLTDPFGGYQMGVTAEKVAEQQDVSREQQDAFALLSQERAAAAIEQGRFDEQIVPIEAPRASEPFTRDEHPRATTLEQLAGLKPVFQKGGSVTAGNSSGINDGAAAVMLMRLSEAKRARPRTAPAAALLGGRRASSPRSWATRRRCRSRRRSSCAGKTIDDIDVIELNEAFAAQAVAVAETLQLPAEKLNPDGGAIALGHPVGATGAILTVKLMHALERTARALGPRLDVHRRRPGLRRRVRAA